MPNLEFLQIDIIDSNNSFYDYNNLPVTLEKLILIQSPKNNYNYHHESKSEKNKKINEDLIKIPFGCELVII